MKRNILLVMTAVVQSQKAVTAYYTEHRGTQVKITR